MSAIKAPGVNFLKFTEEQERGAKLSLLNFYTEGATTSCLTEGVPVLNEAFSNTNCDFTKESFLIALVVKELTTVKVTLKC